MAKRLFCQDNPEALALEAQVLAARPGAVLLDASPFFPGGGGQLPDRGGIAWHGGRVTVTGFQPDKDGLWHEISTPDELFGTVHLAVDRVFRREMCQLHTVAHIANALAFDAFDGALLTGAQLADNGTLRVDFDLPDVDNDRLRALEGPINDVIAQDLAVNTFYMPWDEANAADGMFRSKAVAPPRLEDDTVRIVEIAGLDQQACGGTHVGRTGDIPAVKVVKVENKGRHNRRLRLAVEGRTSDSVQR